MLDPLTWQRLQEMWTARYLFTNSDGVVDDRYLARIAGSSFERGQRLPISEQPCRQAIAYTEALCGNLRVDYMIAPHSVKLHEVGRGLGGLP